MKRRVAIVGFALSSRDKAPFTDPEVEIWGVNELYKAVPRIDVLFELHDRFWLTQKERNPEHLKWLQETSIPVYMLDHYEDIPRSIRFPIELIVKEFGTYFTNSISYLIALAIYLKFDEIGIYGVDMATDSEYGSQRPSVEYFIGVARGRGIDVILPAECDLCKTMHMYGYHDNEITELAKKVKAREQELQGRIQQLSQQKATTEAMLNQLLGARDDVLYWRRNWLYSTPGEQIERGTEKNILSFDEKPSDEFVDVFSQHVQARNPDNLVKLEHIGEEAIHSTAQWKEHEDN